MAINESTEFKKNEVYLRKFDPVAYATLFYTDAFSTDKFALSNDSRQQVILAQHIFREGKIRGKTMLDFPCGPSVVFSIVPSQYYEEVYFADVHDGAREFVQQWWQNEPDCHNFSSFFNLAATLMDKETPWEEGADILRSKIKGVLKGDITDPRVLEESAQPRQFDLVCNSLMLDTVCSNDEEVQIIVQRLAGLVNPKGHLIIYTVFGGEYYMVGNEKFPLTPVDRNVLRKAMNCEGLRLLYWYEQGLSSEDEAQWDGKPPFDGLVYAVSYKE